MMRRSRAALVALAAIACSGEPATLDSGRDIGVDTARDIHDADRDASSDRFDAAQDPEWVRIAGSPDDCYVEYARHPDRLVRVSWVPGVPSVPNCTRALFEPRLLLRPSGRTALWDTTAGRGLFIARNGTAAPGATGIVAVLTTEGAAIVGLRDVDTDPSVTVCPPEIATSNDAVGALIDYFPGPVDGPRPVHLFRGTFDGWFEAALPVGDLASLPRLAGFQDMLTSATVTVSQIVPRGYLLISGEGEPTNHTRPGFAIPYGVVRDDVFWSSEGEVGRTSRIFHTGVSGSDDLLIDGAATGEAFGWFTTDGTTMVWTVVLAPDGVNVEGYAVMTSPYATTAADVIAHRMPVELPATATNLRLGSGVIAYTWYEASTTAHHIEVMQLSDGARSRVSLPIGPSPPRWWVDDMPAWVTDDEVAIPAHGDGEDPTMLRIARSAFVPVP